jgi:signal transduction histidine kinase
VRGTRRAVAVKERDPAARVVAITLVGSVAMLGAVAVAGALVLGGSELAAFWRFLAWGAAGMLPLAALGAFLASRQVASDLSELGSGARAVAGSAGWDRPLPVPCLGEIGELALQLDALRVHYADSMRRARDARRAAEEADRDKTEFLTSVSHELRTPLNAIVGFADVLLAEIDGPLNDGQREDLATIRGAGVHLVTLFTDVLDLSTAASGHLRLDREWVTVEPILQAVATELRGQRQDRPVHIRVSLAPALPPVWADAVRLRQIVGNLGSNALKFTEAGEVRLEAERDADRLILRVADTGQGIDPQDVPLLFAEFGQVGDAVRRLHGTGLGLAICKQLVELHGGTIEVESEPGEGTTFTVGLPLGGGE